MVRLNDVTKVYETGKEALQEVSLRIDDGEFVFLVGPSGSGKSTLTKLLTAEIAPTSGRIMVNGYNLNNIRRNQIPLLRRTLGVVFQDFRLMRNKSVRENLAFVMRVVGSSPHAMRKRIPYVLELVGLEGKEKALPTQLSGGEQQRLAIARALVNNPQMIIADEPTGNLDPELSVEIMELLAQINDLGTTMLVVTHEQSLVDRLDKRVVAIEDGHIIWDKQGRYYEMSGEDMPAQTFVGDDDGEDMSAPISARDDDPPAQEDDREEAEPDGDDPDGQSPEGAPYAED